ncbi:hypothetical protein [Streptomyces sp. A012304]|uniref:hypothetical protein n=1 Tax=Streptomyces sp. A012304 TaxID=375446 RepID=UPI0022303577|nr:hypothetical protein [Streptomyces sp. A012304]GKQ36721.1 hypothetical protein ALMP_32610 [Streptomyces sp. A012304]
MTDLLKKRYAQLGQQLQYDQLGTVRRQAEGWRTGLTGLTGLVGVVFVLKGRESVAGMPDLWRWTTALLLVLAFVLLLVGALWAVRAAHGQLGERTWLSGERLLAAVLDEVERTQRALVGARRLAVAGLCAIVAAIGVSWLVPVEDAAASGKGGPYVVVVTDRAVRCGELVVGDSRAVTLEPAESKGDKGKEGKGGDKGANTAWIRIPVGEIRSLTPTNGC